MGRVTLSSLCGRGNTSYSIREAVSRSPRWWLSHSGHSLLPEHRAPWLRSGGVSVCLSLGDRALRL